MPAMANRIRELRQARGMSLEEVGRRSGLTVQYLSRIERGERRLTDTLMHRIAAALTVQPADLFPRRGKVEAELIESVEELKVLRWWRAMSRQEKFHVITFAKGLGRDISVRLDEADSRHA